MAGSNTARAVLLLAVAACSRHAEIADEPDSGVSLTPAPVDQSELVSVETGLGTDAFVACLDRPDGAECRGANDFPCTFSVWVAVVVRDCQRASGCVSNGRVVARMGDDGCVAELLMSEPNADFVACAAERFGAVKCQCKAQSVEDTLGYGNRGCEDGAPVPCGTGEFRCPVGQTCVEELCMPVENAG